MNTRTSFVIALAAAHLLLVVCGAARVSLPSRSSGTGTALRWYGEMSGSANGYGFFAPAVASQVRATFTLSDDAGRSWIDTLEHGHNHEVTHRVQGIVGTFADEGMQPGLAASAAATLFGRHPGARRIVLRVEVLDLPTMAQYRGGERPTWRLIYQATAVRGGQDSVEQETEP